MATNNHFERVGVSSTTFSVSSTWTFPPNGIALMVVSDEPTDVIEYSFDGTNVHGDLTPLAPSEAICFDNRVQSRVWFRRASAGATIIVRVEAWR